MDISICIATYNKPHALGRVLRSIADQDIVYTYEIIIVDDGSNNEAVELTRYLTKHIFDCLPITLHILHQKETYGNPARARNLAYQEAKGDVIISQSDDVLHGPNVVNQLFQAITPGTFVIAEVINVNDNNVVVPCEHPRNKSLTNFTGPRNRRPLFFLGAVYRRDVYFIGGNDERFTTPGKEDRYFSECLINGLGLVPVYPSGIHGYHLHHPRPSLAALQPSEEVYRDVTAERKWRTENAPWKFS